VIAPQSESPHDVAAYVSRETSPLHDSGGWEPAPFEERWQHAALQKLPSSPDADTSHSDPQSVTLRPFWVAHA